MRVLITGAKGFLGKEIYNFLKRKKFVAYGTSTKKESDGSIFKVDITKAKELKKLPQGIDTIIHLAAVREEFGNATINKKKCFEVNAKGTLNVAKFALKRNVKHFIYISSSTVYKNSKGKIKETGKIKPYSYYGQSKYLGEVYCKNTFTGSEITLTIIRLSSIFGFSQKKFLIHTILDCIEKNKKIIVYGKGKGKWDLIYFKDFLDALLKIIEGKISGLYNIGSGKLISVKEIVETALEVHKKNKSLIAYDKKKQESKQNILLDTTKARKELGFKVHYDIRSAFEDMRKECSKYY